MSSLLGIWANSTTFKSAKTICQLSNWRVSNLALQKLLYLSHMVMLGEHGGRLIDGHFEAWELGPVEPVLYRKVRAYGSGPIEDVFVGEVYNPESLEYKVIKGVYDQLGTARAGILVEITHEQGYAWANCYRPGVKGIVIPDEEILREYNARVATSARDSAA